MGVVWHESGTNLKILTWENRMELLLTEMEKAVARAQLGEKTRNSILDMSSLGSFLDLQVQILGKQLSI